MPVAVGDDITADWGNSVRSLFIQKASSESVTSSTTLQDDNDIVVSLAANGTYKITLHLAYTAATAADIKVAWATTGGVASKTLRACFGLEASTTTSSASLMRFNYASALTTAVVYGGDGAATWCGAQEEFLVETTTAGTSGTLKLQWAQNVSSGTATVATVGTWVEILEVESA